MTKQSPNAEELFKAVVSLAAEEQCAYLDAHCDDLAVRSEVEKLLRYDQMQGGRLTDDSPRPALWPTDDHSSRESGLREIQRPAVATSSGSIDHGRFLPGTVLSDRYRIVGRLGKGGMGEVYRADDLELGQSVALKFLPRRLVEDARALKRFRGEVRLARQISHPNVCRVYDIGHIDNDWYLSMEYVDGEDLAQLLKRIGRFPQDRAIELARQLCLGLNAAHENGVLHRDLKPANVMVDGRGKLLITDFGLAEIAEHVRDEDIRSGTPAYMAPEQLAGKEVTARSDIYSLGIVLHEMFTGKPVWEAESLAELVEKRRDSSTPSPSSHVEGLDPVIERVIQRCLESDPEQRPSSAISIAAALPGGDPLAAALAAGEMPSPALVAASGETGTLPLRTGLMCLLIVLVGVLLLPFHQSFGVSGWLLKKEKSLAKPEKLEGDIQDDILAPLGYFDSDAPPQHAVYGLNLQQQLDGSIRREFWYRQRHGGFINPVIEDLYRWGMNYTISLTNPSPFEAGMTSVRVDMQGNLIELLSTHRPPESIPAARFDVDKLIRLAGLEPENYRRLEKPAEHLDWSPPVYADETAVFQTISGNPTTCIVMAWHRKSVVYLYVGPLSTRDLVGRWFVPANERSQTSQELFGQSSAQKSVQLIVLLCSIVIAIRNVRKKHVDTRGALRFSMFIGGCLTAVWFTGVWHTTNLGREVIVLQDFSYKATGQVLRYWVYYLALEPFVRRYWPNVLVAWTRASDGRLLDPLVGQELLVGCVGGTMLGLIHSVFQAISGRFSNDGFHAITHVAGYHLNIVGLAVQFSIFMLLFLFLVRVALRNTLASVVVFSTVWTLVIVAPAAGFGIQLVGHFAMSAAFAILVARFGLIAGGTVVFFFMILTVPLTPDITAWYGQATLTSMGCVTAISFYGFFISTIVGVSQRPGLSRA